MKLWIKKLLSLLSTHLPSVQYKINNVGEPRVQCISGKFVQILLYYIISREFFYLIYVLLFWSGGLEINHSDCFSGEHYLSSSIDRVLLTFCNSSSSWSVTSPVVQFTDVCTCKQNIHRHKIHIKKKFKMKKLRNRISVIDLVHII